MRHTVLCGSLSNSLAEGTTVRLAETTLWYLFLEALGDNLFGLLSRAPEWLYEIRWGPKDPEWGIADRSLGSRLYILSQWCGGAFGTWNKRRHVASFPVTSDWVREHFPDAGWPFDGSDPEDEEDE